MQTPQLESGVVLAGKYRLDHLLGEGGMGQVWAAVHTLTGRQVAIKRLRGKSTDDARAQARFVREARAACSVDHPNIVQVIDFIAEEEEPALMVMELLRGETLGAKLARERQFGPTQASELLLPVVSALGAAHAKGIVHRDLKPANIFICRAAEQPPLVKVLDFGIAKWAEPGQEEGGSLLTQSGCMLGTPCYMAPEQALAERVDHRADIWSLGAVLYECLAGRRPIEGNNPAQVQTRLLTTGIVPLSRLVPGLDPELVRLVDRMLARTPTLRPQTLAEVARVLSHVGPRERAMVAPRLVSAPITPQEPELEQERAPDTCSLQLPTTSVPIAGPSRRLERALGLGGAVSAAALAIAFGMSSVEPSSNDDRRADAALTTTSGAAASAALPLSSRPPRQRPASAARPGSLSAPSTALARAPIASRALAPRPNPSAAKPIRVPRPAARPSKPALPGSGARTTRPSVSAPRPRSPAPDVPAPAARAPELHTAAPSPATSDEGAELPFDKTNPYDEVR